MSAASSMNALKHGLFAESPVLPNEDPAPFEAFRNQFTQDLAPQGLLEEQLTADLASLRWRLIRCQALENRILADPAMSTEAQINSLAKYSLYEHRITRKFTQTLKQLQTLQSERQAKQEAEMNYAVAIALECKATATPFSPAEFGFVFSNSEVQIRLNRHERLQAAAKRGSSRK